MTGFGKASGKAGNYSIAVEIRTLNSKSFELSLRIPSAFKNVEFELRTLLRESLERGKVDVHISYENTGPANSEAFNNPLLDIYLSALKKIALKNKLDSGNLLPAVLTLPGVISTEQPELTKKQWNSTKVIIKNALDNLQSFREKEGKALENDLVRRLQKIRQLEKQVASSEHQRKLRIRNRMISLFREAQVKPDQNRLEQELIFYIEKLDVTEELVRLNSHCSFFEETLHEKKSNGRKLGFILQEMNREINTLGSKANDAPIQQLVVEMKDELEKMKEQSANIL